MAINKHRAEQKVRQMKSELNQLHALDIDYDIVGGEVFLKYIL
jgi:hypothetical protein